jgi:hypothetical protein
MFVLPTYLFIHHLSPMSYLPTYLPIFYLSIYLPTIYLLMKKIEAQMLLYTLKKHFIEVQGYMLNPFRIIVLINMYLSAINYIVKHQ